MDPGHDCVSESTQVVHKWCRCLRINLRQVVLLCVLTLLVTPANAGTETFLPNTDNGMERIFGLGVVHPHPYFQRPRHRYPVYDRDGRGSLVYGYGGDEVYPYREFDSIEGYH